MSAPDRRRMYARLLDGTVVEDDRSRDLNLRNCLALWSCEPRECYSDPADGCPCGRTAEIAAARERVRRVLDDIGHKYEGDGAELTDAELDAVISAARGGS